MKIIDLKNKLSQLKEVHTENGLAAKMYRKVSGYSQSIQEIEKFLSRFNDDHNLSPTEQYEFGDVLFNPDTKTPDPEREIIFSFQTFLWGANSRIVYAALKELHNHQILTQEYLDIVKDIPDTAYLLTTYKRFRSVNEFVINLLRKKIFSLGTVQNSLDLLQQEGILTSTTVTILDNPDRDIDAVINALSKLNQEGIFFQEVTELVKRIGVKSNILKDSELNDLITVLIKLKKENILNNRTIKDICHVLDTNIGLLTTKAEALIKLDKAGLWKYSATLRGPMGRFHPNDIADVMIILHGAGALDDTAIEAINMHRQPEIMKAPLIQLQDARPSLLKPKYINVVLNRGDANQIIDSVILLEKANINFNINDAYRPELRKVIEILNKAPYLNQSSFDRVQPLPDEKLPSIYLRLNMLHEEKLFSEDTFGKVLNGELDLKKIHALIDSRVALKTVGLVASFGSPVVTQEQRERETPRPM